MSIIVAILMGLLAYASLNIGMILEKKGVSILPQIEKTSALNSLKNFISCKII